VRMLLKHDQAVSKVSSKLQSAFSESITRAKQIALERPDRRNTLVAYQIYHETS
jgi:hypothetical protein